VQVGNNWKQSNVDCSVKLYKYQLNIIYIRFKHKCSISINFNQTCFVLVLNCDFPDYLSSDVNTRFVWWFIPSNLISKALRYGSVNEGSYSFTCHSHVYPKMEWVMPAFTFSCRASPHLGWYSIPSWWGLEAELSVAGYIPTWFAHMKTVTNLSTNQAQCRVTLLMHPTLLPLHQTTSLSWRHLIVMTDILCFCYAWQVHSWADRAIIHLLV